MFERGDLRMTAAPTAWSWWRLRVWLAPLLLVLVVWFVDPAALWTTLKHANPGLVGLALLLSTAANLLSASRWAVIARRLGLSAPKARLVLMYARGITTNTLLPGASLSGDVLRSVQLSRLGNPLGTSALSVLLDRLSGLWVLSMLSLFAAVSVALGASGEAAAGIGPNRLHAYLLIMAGIALAPFTPLLFERWISARPAWIARLASRWERLRALLRQARPALLASIWQSLGVQLLAAATLWLCGLAVGVSLPYPLMLVAAAPIFISAALPIGVGGFGTRELAAVIVLGLAGVPADLAAATAILFGVTVSVQGILAAPLVFTKP